MCSQFFSLVAIGTVAITAGLLGHDSQTIAIEAAPALRADESSKAAVDGIVEHSAEGTAAAAMRTWTDVSGKFHTEARLLNVEDGKVHLEKTNGDTISVPLEKLSERDQEFATAHAPHAPGRKAALGAGIEGKSDEKAATETSKPPAKHGNVSQSVPPEAESRPSTTATPVEASPSGSEPSVPTPTAKSSADAEAPSATRAKIGAALPRQKQNPVDSSSRVTDQGAWSLAWVVGGAASVLVVGILAFVRRRAARRGRPIPPSGTSIPRIVPRPGEYFISCGSVVPRVYGKCIRGESNGLITAEAISQASFGKLEVGPIPVDRIIRVISQEEFEKAREDGWP